MGSANWERLLKFRCTGCGNCCKKTYICVTDADVNRLVEGTGKPADEIVRFAKEDEIHLNKRHPWWVRFANRRGVMVLRWKRGRCQFLGDDNRCGVYAHRPIVCRLHPYNVTLTHDDWGGIEKLSLSHLTECPHEWDGNETKKNLGLLERLLWRDSNRYIPLVEAWNKRKPGEKTGRRTPAAYLAELFGAASTAAKKVSRAKTTSRRLAKPVVGSAGVTSEQAARP